MTRLLFWIALAILVVAAIRSKLRSAGANSRPSQPPQPRDHPSEAAADALRCCAHCGVYFPASEAVRADGLDYCSPAHVRQPAK